MVLPQSAQPRGELVVVAVAARMGHAEPVLVGHHDGGEPFVFAAGLQLQPQRIGQFLAGLYEGRVSASYPT